MNKVKETYREIAEEERKNKEKEEISTEKNEIQTKNAREEPKEEPKLVRVFYPEINYQSCIKCMVCVKLCPNQVFEIKNGYPAVTNPMACDPDCQICGVKCPTKAISFISKVKWG